MLIGLLEGTGGMQALCLATLLMIPGAEVDFDVDIAPIFTRAGCNAAACHGAAAGRGDFKLSLFAGDLDADYDAIVRQFEGRRIDYQSPAYSLLLAKPTGFLEHGGGERLDVSDPVVARITEWIRQGTPRRNQYRYVGLRFETADVSLDSLPKQISLRLLAALEDRVSGQVRWQDVSELSLLIPGDADALLIENGADIRVTRGGRHPLVGRFLNLVATTQITAPLDALAPLPAAAAANLNWIDEQVDDTLRQLGLPVSPPADDAALLRRLTLHLTGRLPEPQAVDAYLADDDPQKYAGLVERLLASPEFTDYWSFRLSELLRIRVPGNEREAATAFRDWLRAQIAAGTGLDEMARTLIVAEGDSHSYGPANFYRQAGDARQQAEYVSEVLCGVRLRCANCHNHPLDRWTQDDYHGLAALFAPLETGRFVKLRSRGEVIHPGTGQAAIPRVPGQTALEKNRDGRQALAEWLTAPDNAYFAPAFANRIWKALMGRGLIEPTDDLRETNPATHPLLLEKLSQGLRDNGFELRWAIREIVMSQAYRRDSRAVRGNAGDDRFYSHVRAQPLSAEVLLDAIDDVTGVATNYADEAAAVRAITLLDPDLPSPALDALGRCARGESCESAAADARGVAGSLHLWNGALLNAKLRDPAGWLPTATAEGRSTEWIFEQLYRRALSRPPTDKERAYWLPQLAAETGQQQELLEDFVWSLLNCQEFVTNH
jgi:hypothetical protein